MSETFRGQRCSRVRKVQLSERLRVIEVKGVSDVQGSYSFRNQRGS